MKAIILAAGYATRLGELTKNQPKALLKIKDTGIIDYICRQIEQIDEIDDIYVISNDKFYNNFIEWSKNANYKNNITILNDGSTTDENKLGAIGDIVFAIDEMKINDDILIIAGDNLFSYSLKDFYEYFLKIKSNCICVKKNENLEDLTRMGVAQLDCMDKIIGFEEKPKKPKSDIAVYATYIYEKSTLPLFKKYLEEGNNPDAPGYFPAWLYKIKNVYGYKFEGVCYDIGTVESYKEANENFGW